MLWYATYRFKDNNGGVAEVRRRYFSDAPPINAVLQCAPILQSISSAALFDIQIETEFQYDAEAPDELSTVYKRLYLLFRDNDRTTHGILSIPSPSQSLPIDETGAYRLVRLSREALLLSGMLDTLEGAVSSILLAGTTKFLTHYVVGGTTRS